MSDDNAPKKVSINYQGNSNKKRATEKKEEPREKKVEKVTEGEAIKRKKPLRRKIAETFTGEDMQSVGTYILFEVLIPASKTMISDAVSQGVERTLFGDTIRRSPGAASRPRQAHTSYHKMYSPNDDRVAGPRTMSSRAKATHDFDEVILPSRGDAEAVLEGLDLLIAEYDVATVADLYELVDITGSFQDDKWGWTDIRGASVTRVSQGYLLNLPRPIALD